MKTNIFALILIVLPFIATCQEEISVKKLNKEFIGYLVFDDLYSANKTIDQLLTIDSLNAGYLYQKGLLELNFSEDYSSALNYFLKAQYQKSLLNKRIGEVMVPSEFNYYLALAFHKTEQYVKAIETYQNYLKKAGKKDYFRNLAQLNLKQCENSLMIFDKPTNLVVENMGEEVNSIYADYSTVFGNGANEFFFSSRRPWLNQFDSLYFDVTDGQFKEDIYQAKYSESKKNFQIEKLTGSNQLFNESPVGINYTNSALHCFTDKTGDGDIYDIPLFGQIYDLTNSQIAETINSEYTESHFVLSFDGNFGFFSSNRPGGFGGQDIYIVKRKKNGEWGLPQNLGNKINTEFDEDSPFFNAAGDILYFASNGPNSCGGYDIFYSIWKDSIFTEPTNIGFPINSPADDIFFTQALDGNHFLLTSNRKGGLGKTDIYRVDFKNSEIIEEPDKYTKLKATLSKDSSVNWELVPDFSNLYVKMSCVDCDFNKIIAPENSNTSKDLGGLKSENIIKIGSTMSSFDLNLSSKYTYEIEIINQLNNGCLYKEEINSNQIEIEDRLKKELNRNFMLTIENDSLKCKLITDLHDDSIVTIISSNRTEIGYSNPYFKQFFNDNQNRVFFDKNKMRVFLKEIERQLLNGRSNITLKIYSSASKVPTKKFKSNEELSALRAENLKEDLIKYFKNNQGVSSKIKIEIVSTIVDGPEYVTEKRKSTNYKLYQFVEIVTE